MATPACHSLLIEFLWRRSQCLFFFCSTEDIVLGLCLIIVCRWQGLHCLVPTCNTEDIVLGSCHVFLALWAPRRRLRGRM